MNINITSALFRGNEISGQFPLVKKYWSDKSSKRGGRVAIKLNGKKCNVTLSKTDFEYVSRDLTEKQSSIMDVIKTNDSCNSKLLSEYTGLTMQSVGGVVRSLAMYGLIKKSGQEAEYATFKVA